MYKIKAMIIARNIARGIVNIFSRCRIRKNAKRKPRVYFTQLSERIFDLLKRFCFPLVLERQTSLETVKRRYDKFPAKNVKVGLYTYYNKG